MSEAAKFFRDNISTIAPSDPMNWNLYRGLLAMAAQLNEVQQQLAQLQAQVAQQQTR